MELSKNKEKVAIVPLKEYGVKSDHKYHDFASVHSSTV